jgi:serine/threonine protein kinase
MYSILIVYLSRYSLFYIIICIHRMADVMGSGHFGVVFKGEWAAAPGVEGERNINVAVKILKTGTAKKNKVKFLQEAAIIGQFSHPNVVKLLGVVIGEQVRI